MAKSNFRLCDLISKFVFVPLKTLPTTFYHEHNHCKNVFPFKYTLFLSFTFSLVSLKWHHALTSVVVTVNR